MISRGRATHSDKLERWLGKECVENISYNFGKFYWPVPLHGVPGNVYVMPGGDFAGEIKAGSFMNKHDGAALTIQKIKKRIDAGVRRSKALMSLADLIRNEHQFASVGAFASIDAVVAAWKAGKGNILPFHKTGVASNAIGNSNDLWYRAGSPGAGASGASPTSGGTVWTAASTGALSYKNLGTADGGHYLNWALNASVAGNSLLLYDRLWSCDAGIALTSSTRETTSGVPTRYQSTDPTSVEFLGGNFTYPVATSVLAATAHTRPGSGISSNGVGISNQENAFLPTDFWNGTGVSACVSGGIDLAAGQSSWFILLGKTTGGSQQALGARTLLEIDCSPAVATGTVDWVIAHPIAVNACPIANVACMDDGLYTSFNLTSILDDACLSFIELPKPTTTATTYAGVVRTVGE